MTDLFEHARMIEAHPKQDVAKEKRITHMEAILWHCNKQGIEPDTVSSLISKSLKEKVEANARELNFLPRQAQLPV